MENDNKMSMLLLINRLILQGFQKLFMSKKYQNVNNLKVSEELLSFVNKELLKDLDISSEKFWSGFDNAVHELTPKNKELIQIREDLQKKIDDWHIKNRGNEINIEEYKKLLKEIVSLQE